MSPEDFEKALLPALVERWRKGCFCTNPGFLKLLSFDFHDYKKLAPVELIDSERVWSAIIGKHFHSLGDWIEEERMPVRYFQCPQCKCEFRTWSEQYSINMWPTSTRPTDGRRLADVGYYLLGFHYFVGKFDPRWIADFREAPDAQTFIESITTIRDTPMLPISH